MSTISRLVGALSKDARNDDTQPTGTEANLDGALDTVSNILQVMGSASFAIDDEIDTIDFQALCAAFARHVENGSPVPAWDVPQDPGGRRAWNRVRRFFADRRKAEARFVSERLHDYRGIVDELVSGLRNVVQRDKKTEDTICQRLEIVQLAVDAGDVTRIRDALAEAVQEVEETFAEQKRDYEKRLTELNDRMASLRQDLVDAREEMQRDSLTDAFNRGAFDQAIQRNLNMHHVLQQPITLLLIDVDHFKDVNDRFGHAAGDEALRKLGDCLTRSFIRKSDFVARYGGDEFAVILPDTRATHASKLVDGFLRRAEAIRLDSGPDEALVTCSVGYTELEDEDTVEALLARADKALYKAKSAGRNCAEFVALEDLEA
ncbi:MAG: diguanylate cyclase [Woeseiaceae bacterium]|nr:diguanylate cyclase [Woeseiaceae bacterium]